MSKKRTKAEIPAAEPVAELQSLPAQRDDVAELTAKSRKLAQAVALALRQSLPHNAQIVLRREGAALAGAVLALTEGVGGGRGSEPASTAGQGAETGPSRGG